MFPSNPPPTISTDLLQELVLAALFGPPKLVHLISITSLVGLLM